MQQYKKALLQIMNETERSCPDMDKYRKQWNWFTRMAKVNSFLKEA